MNEYQTIINVGAGSALASLRRGTTNSVSGTTPGTAATGDIYQGTFSYILG